MKKVMNWMKEKVAKAVEHVAGHQQEKAQEYSLIDTQLQMIGLGVNPTMLLTGHKVGKSRSATRKGPGRLHQQGKPQGETSELTQR